jgi:hypothetical protein
MTSPEISSARMIALNGGTPFAVRYIYQHERTDKAEPGKIIMPLPEFGAVAYNVEIQRGLRVDWRKLKRAEDAEGLSCKLRADVYAGSVHLETWFAVETPKGFETIAHFVANFIGQEHRLLSKPTKTPPQSIKRVAGEDRLVDHAANTRAVAMDLLRRDYPQFFRALDNRLTESETRKAFLADCIAREAPVVPVESLDALIQDTGFYRWLAAAMAKPGRKVKPNEWELALGWIRCGYFQMSDDQLEVALNERTGLNLKGASWTTKAARLGLVNDRKLGRPDSFNDLPPL